MSSQMKKGVAVWVLGFFTFLAFLNAFNSVMMWVMNGSNFVFTPYLISQYIGNLQIAQYFWISVTATFVFLGLTAIIGFRDSYSIEKKMFNRMEAQRKANETFFKVFDSNLLNIRKEILNNQKVTREHIFTIDASIDDVRSELSQAIKRQEDIGNNVEAWSKVVNKTRKDTLEMKKGLKAVKTALIFPEPKITVDSSPAKIKGIGPRTAEELEAIGITNAGEFLTMDPIIIGEKTRLHYKNAAYLQGLVQLLMIPEINEIDVELLEKVGVTNRKELASQDPFELTIKLSEVAKAFAKDGKIKEAQKPTLEKVLSWVRLAKI